MAQRTIRFRIRPDGRVEETVEGIQGEGCQQLTERIEARLGSVQQRRPTAEAFQSGVSQGAIASQSQSLEQLGSTFA
ncbi:MULTISPECIES: DUF2997 domain-containing protein [unclassified Synechococcus]|uniref:DUF2997 domain-containing protein n=1 Tax=unclassified Synechococcus TaxID=2626047 RepID=UPI002AD4A06F|nr:MULTISPECIES: DUF2997 domain-containing protein [unclassified Synechococcus]MEA5423517.1 DUF2997 domain-containing protein [Synechococcus sp. CCY9202]CAK6691091.1 hypothetical protein IFHNHDMJ_00948 [Synechococcus sp. CBW1107]